MRKEDLIKARVITQKLLCKTIKEFGISMVTLILCGLFANVFLPTIVDKIAIIAILLFGMTFGIMIGALRAYNIFWEKTDFENAKDGDIITSIVE